MTDLSSLNHPASIKANVSARPGRTPAAFLFPGARGTPLCAGLYSTGHRKGRAVSMRLYFFAVYGMEAASKVY